MMKKLTLILIFVVTTFAVKATGQAADILLWNNDTLALFSNPLESHKEHEGLRAKLFEQIEKEVNTACWRGYVAEWELKGNELYLTNIYNCSGNRVAVDLERMFPNEIANGKVKADWVNEVLVVPKGECLFYGNVGYLAIYERELELTVSNGVLVKEEEYDNSRTRKSVFTQNVDTLNTFVYSSIKWDSLPDEPAKVYVGIVTTGTNKPDVRIIRGAKNEAFNVEALRVANLIPDWDVYYQRGKVMGVHWTLPIVFSKENRERYTR